MQAQEGEREGETKNIISEVYGEEKEILEFKDEEVL